MEEKVLIKKDGMNYASMIVGLLLIYSAYRKYNNGSVVFAMIILLTSLLSFIHNYLLLTSPLLIHKDEFLIIKPKIPFEKKKVIIKNINAVSINDNHYLLLKMNDGKTTKLKFSMIKLAEKQEVRKYIQELIGSR